MRTPKCQPGDFLFGQTSNLSVALRRGTVFTLALFTARRDSGRPTQPRDARQMLSLSLAATGVSVAANVTDSVRFEQYLQSRTLALGTVSNTYIKTASVGRYPEGFAEESYNGAEGVIQGADTTLTVSGNVRAYWVQDSDQHAWSSLEYVPLDLRGKSLRWTSDMSRVGCACNAALYLVAMPPRGHGDASGYCDIQGSGKGECLEIDLLEGNKKAIQTTLHTQTGKSSDGTCNQYGCAVNWGKDDQSHYGLGSMIDSGRPYELDAAFDDDGHMTVRIQQDGVWHDYWDVHSAGNGRKGVPEEASKAVADAMGRGLVLTVSLWEAKDNMAWLNGECNNQCEAAPSCTALSPGARPISAVALAAQRPRPQRRPHRQPHPRPACSHRPPLRPLRRGRRLLRHPCHRQHAALALALALAADAAADARAGAVARLRSLPFLRLPGQRSPRQAGADAGAVLRDVHQPDGLHRVRAQGP